MGKGLLGCLAVVVLIVIIAVVAFGGTYNHLVALQQAVDAQWAQVENVYQRRADLIPNLVATVQGAANFEKSVLTEVTQARASVGQVQVQAKVQEAVEEVKKVVAETKPVEEDTRKNV